MHEKSGVMFFFLINLTWSQLVVSNIHSLRFSTKKILFVVVRLLQHFIRVLFVRLNIVKPYKVKLYLKHLFSYEKNWIFIRILRFNKVSIVKALPTKNWLIWTQQKKKRQLFFPFVCTSFYFTLQILQKSC